MSEELPIKHNPPMSDETMGAVENNLNACPTNQPWEMSRSEYLDSQLGVPDSRGRKIGHPVAVQYEDMKHKASVRGALKAGKPVPAAVLAEYPDLAPKSVPLKGEYRAKPPTPETLAFDPDLKIIKPKNVTDRGLVSYLQRESNSWDFVQTAKDSGLVTDGKMLFFATNKDIAALAKVPDDKDARTMPTNQMEKVFANYVKDDYVKAKVVGARKTGPYGDDGGIVGDAYMLESGNDNRTAVDAKFLRTIQTRYLGADILIHCKLPGETAIMLELHGKIVGVIMPLMQKSYFCLLPKRDTQRKGGFGL